MEALQLPSERESHSTFEEQSRIHASAASRRSRPTDAIRSDPAAHVDGLDTPPSDTSAQHGLGGERSFWLALLQALAHGAQRAVDLLLGGLIASGGRLRLRFARAGAALR